MLKVCLQWYSIVKKKVAPTDGRERGRKMLVYKLDSERFVEAEVKGTYGCPELPVVEIDGVEAVATLRRMDTRDAVCLSAGCDYCTGTYDGCRCKIGDDVEVAYCV